MVGGRVGSRMDDSAVDLGPLIGLWYAAVSVLLLRRPVLAQDAGFGAGADTEDMS